MKFFNINLNKDSSVLLHGTHNPFYWRIFKKTILLSGSKNLYKKSAEQKNEGIKPDKNFESEKNQVYAQKR
jgi:hypothetical protein